MIIVQWSPQPYSNCQDPYIRCSCAVVVGSVFCRHYFFLAVVVFFCFCVTSFVVVPCLGKFARSLIF